MHIMKPVIGSQGYFITLDGRVWSRKSKRFLSPGRTTRGYLTVYLCNRGIPSPRSVHRLVANAFIKRSETRDQVNHIDGDKQNNHFNNLEWVTARENDRHRIDVLKSGIGESHGFSKLLEGQILDIRKKYSAGERTQITLAKDYGVNKATISKIVNRKLWKHI